VCLKYKENVFTLQILLVPIRVLWCWKKWHLNAIVGDSYGTVCSLLSSFVAMCGRQLSEMCGQPQHET